MADKYKLEGKLPVLVSDLMEWARWYETADRVVARDHVEPDITVSTVFLGMDYQFGDGPPLLFETCVFGGEFDGDMERCSTWGDAEVQHRRVMEVITQ